VAETSCKTAKRARRSTEKWILGVIFLVCGVEVQPEKKRRRKGNNLRI